MFTVAKEQGCNKIALGHHMDDILETLLMNITYQGAFSSMPPRLVMKKFDMTIIRPMCLVPVSYTHLDVYKRQGQSLVVAYIRDNDIVLGNRGQVSGRD